MSITPHTTQGFTIVETLVAVAVLMIAIAGPLTIAVNGLNSALIAKNEIVASYLAQEATDAIKNIRDNNYLNDPTGWVTTPYGNVRDCTSAIPCTVDINATTNAITIGSGSGQLYMTANGKYTNVSTGNRSTPFSRIFWLTPSLTNGDEYRVEVQVSWLENQTVFLHTLKSLIFKVIR